jgi:RNA polymerase sigma-70 factor (ECF subfamily)
VPDSGAKDVMRRIDFRSSFEQNAPFVRRTLRRLGIPPADSEDLVQEIFVVVHRKLGDYDGRSPFRSWVYGICLRVVSSYRRSARVRYELPQADGALDECESHVACDPERIVEVRRACLLLETLLIRLDDDKRKVFVLFELEGVAMSQVAETLGCPLQTAYSRLHAARKALRAVVERYRDAS